MPVNQNLLRGALEMVILGVIDDGASYGYEIARTVRETTDGRLLAQEGTLYPLLHRLEERGYLRSHWEGSPKGRQRKHYFLTRAGRNRWGTLRREWDDFSASVNRILKLSYIGNAF